MNDETKNHVMRCHLEGDGYITMTWPKKMSVKMLDHCLKVVTMQLVLFREQAQKEADADVEYLSWGAPNDAPRLSYAERRRMEILSEKRL